MKLSRVFVLGLTIATLSGCDIKTVISNTGNDTAQSKNQQPTITSFTSNPTNTATPGQAITFSVDVVDPDNDILKYSWSATGGTLSTNTGRVVNWTPPQASGSYIIQVSISDQKGGTAEGSQNVMVKEDGTAKVGQ